MKVENRENIKVNTQVPENILTPEQDIILDLYIQSLDSFFEEVKHSERTQVEIETLHLKRILSK